VPRFTPKGALHLLNRYVKAGLLADSAEVQNVREELTAVLEGKTTALTVI